MLQQASLLSGRQMILLGIIALHALIISALMTMRIMPDVQSPQVPLIGRIDPPREIPVPPPPEIPVTMAKPRVTMPQVPAPIVKFPDADVVAPYVAPVETGPVDPVPAQTGAGENPVPAIPATALQFRAVRPADDYYPRASLKLQEEGTAIVQVCVTPAGKLDGNPVIRSSSGSSRLDAAALKWAREALRFTPATRGGVAVAACKGFRVKFTLH
jgi:protein TonB